jgi:transposase
LDAHKKTISVAMELAATGAEVRFYGTVADTPDVIRALCRTLTRDGQQLYFCDEAGSCGYGVHRLLARLGHRRELTAPALIPRKRLPSPRSV